jgi:hypothetical protein
MKLGVLFRGPIRPSIQSVMQKRKLLVDQLKGHDVTTYLATWSTWKGSDSTAILSNKMFDTVLSQPVVKPERIHKFTSKIRLPSSTYVNRVFSMYYQTLTALNIMIQQDDYDFIIHARTDCSVVFGNMNDWFDKDHYVTDGYIMNTPLLPKDWITVATPDIMKKVWDYGSLTDLGKMIDSIDVTERLISRTIERAQVRTKFVEVQSIELDPHRVE